MSNMEAPPAYPSEEPIKSIWDDRPTPSATVKTYRESNTVNKGVVILSLVCCTFFGRMALYYNREAEERYSARAYVEGDEAAKKARIWAWLGIVIGTIVLLLVVGGLTAWLVLRFGVTRV